MGNHMKSEHSRNWWRACILGAINGVLFGGTAEILREMYNDYQWRRITEESERLGLSPPLMGDSLHWWAIPLWATVFFILTSLFVHKFWANRVKSPILLWQIIGVTGVTVWSIFWQTVVWLDGPPSEQRAIARDVKSLLAGDSFYDLITSRSILQDWLICLALVVVMNLIYGAVIQLSVSLYERKSIS
jgi:hypothetical protein